MANSRFATSFCLGLALFLGVLCSFVQAAPAAAESGLNDVDANFKTFSSNLLKESDLDEFSIEKGAAISSPFGVGYMLANIHNQVWNVSNQGFERVLKSPKEKISAEYASLLEKLNKANMITNSVLYVRDRNTTVSLPQGSQTLKTEMIHADFIADWKTSWFAMNDMITNQTGGTLNDQLVPKGGWWGGAFYPFTTSAYINTNHYRGAWEKSWTSIGEKQFWDGLSVPFYQAEGQYPVMEAENYTAVAIPLADKGKFAVFVLPKGKLVQFIRGDLAKLLMSSDPTSWQISKSNKKIQVPALNITLLDQHYKKLETLGINHTFCMPDGVGPEQSDDGETSGKNLRGTYFSSPIVQAHHIHLSPDYVEVASATGSSVNSEEKLKEDHAPDYDYGPPSASDNGPVDAPLDDFAAIVGGGDDDENAEVVVPVVLDDQLARSLAEGSMEVKGVDLTMADPKTNETINAQGSLLDNVPSASDDALEEMSSGFSSSSVGNSTSDVAEPAPPSPSPQSSTVAPSSTTIKNSDPIPDVSSSTVAPEVVSSDTLQFSQPFFWYLFDKELGPLYYGTIHSLATYKKEYGLETDEDFWLFDAYKTLLWNCP